MGHGAAEKRMNPFCRHVGLEPSGEKSFRLKVTDQHTNSLGYAHGGAIFTLADRAFADAFSRRGVRIVTLEMKINYLLPVKTGDALTTRVKVAREGRSTVVGTVEVLRKKEVVALAQGTGFCIGIK